MANHTLSTDDEDKVAVLKMAGYGVKYSVHLWRWMLYRLDNRAIILSDINKHDFFRDCMSYLGRKGEST